MINFCLAIFCLILLYLSIEIFKYKIDEYIWNKGYSRKSNTPWTYTGYHSHKHGFLFEDQLKNEHWFWNNPNDF